MRRTTLIVAAVAVLAVGAIFASNMGFKINYRLAEPGEAVPGGTSLNGTNAVGLPYNPQAGITTAQALFDDIGSASVQNISKFLQSDNGYAVYSLGGSDYALSPGEGYFVRMKTGAGTDYIIVGSHDPSLSVSLAGTGQAVPGGTSLGGQNFFAPPYHGTATDAQQLADDIGSTDVQNIAQFVESNNGFTIFTPGGGSPFTITPGEAYIVRIKSGITKNYTPSHY